MFIIVRRALKFGTYIKNWNTRLFCSWEISHFPNRKRFIQRKRNLRGGSGKLFTSFIFWDTEVIRVSVDAGNVGEQSYGLKISKSLNKKKKKKKIQEKFLWLYMIIFIIVFIPILKLAFKKKKNVTLFSYLLRVQPYAYHLCSSKNECSIKIWSWRSMNVQEAWIKLDNTQLR